MGTVSIDHLAIPTANAERLIAFYKKLGFRIIGTVEDFPAGHDRCFMRKDYR